MKKTLLIFVFLILAYSLCIYFVYYQFTHKAIVIKEESKEELHLQIKQTTHDMIQAHFKSNIKGKDRLILPKKMKITGYAPLDPNAVKGMCYSGDPNVTASGRQTQPGITVAAGRGIPFGTMVHIPDLGWRVVEDRGGMIKDNRIDVCFATRKEALEWGIKERQVSMIFPLKED